MSAKTPSTGILYVCMLMTILGCGKRRQDNLQSQPSTKSDSLDQAIKTNETTSGATQSGIQILPGHVFVLATDFDAVTCEVEAGCDCCASELIFLNATEFVRIDVCMYNDSYYRGTYSISDTKLTLNFDPKVADEITDEESGKITIRLRSYTIKSMDFDISICGNKIVLHESETQGVHGSRYDEKRGLETIEELKKNSVWRELDR